MYRIGIDLGGTNISAGLVGDGGKLLFKSSMPTELGGSDVEITELMANFCLQIAKRCDISERDIDSIGIGCPGVCDDENGILLYTVNLPFRNTNIAKIFSKFIGAPVHLANDANCAALGEVVAGGAKGYKSSITLTLGTGVGGGIIIDGKIYTGFNHAAGEMGHIAIHAGGESCGCGRKGCLEAYASATALIREAKRAFQEHPDCMIRTLCEGDLNKINAKTPFDAKRAGDKIGTAIVDKYIRDLGEGIINYINIFQPEIILLGGGVSKEGDYLLVPLREYVFQYSYGHDFLPQTKIECAMLGNDAGIIGAAMLD
ncbi:MAG: ROK family protein [Clostridiales bacterium]|nr:ROK family protein [Clostridiales bacterium]